MIEHEHEDHDGYGYWFELPVGKDEQLYTTTEFLWACKSGLEFRIAKLPKYDGMIGTGFEVKLSNDHFNWSYYTNAFDDATSNVPHHLRREAMENWFMTNPEPSAQDALCIGFQTKNDAAMYKLAN